MSMAFTNTFTTDISITLPRRNKTLLFAAIQRYKTLLCVTCSSKVVFSTLHYEWAQQARVLCYNRLERFASNKHSSLLDPFVSYEENKVF
jgi:hypothetical protein